MSTKNDIYQWLKSIWSGEILVDDQSLIGVDLDFVIPDRHLAIEFNDTNNHCYPVIPRNYHLLKTDACKEKGFRLINITEVIYDKKADIYKSIISSQLGLNKRIYARDCKFGGVQKSDEKAFLNINHLHGAAPSQQCFGLYYKGELVQLASFGKSRFMKGEYEMIRMCTKKFTNVVGGFSKLIQHAPVDHFVSYVDRSVYDGNGYEKSGFDLIGIPDPAYYYVDDQGKLTNRVQWQKHKLHKLLPNFDPNKTEQQNMLDDGRFKIIYDSGNYKYRYDKNKVKENVE